MSALKLKSMKNENKLTRRDLVNLRYNAGEFKPRRVTCISSTMGPEYQNGQQYNVAIALLDGGKIQVFLTGETFYKHRPLHKGNSHRVFDNLDHFWKHFKSQNHEKLTIEKNYARLISINKQLKIKE